VIATLSSFVKKTIKMNWLYPATARARGLSIV
jgi:hypothetical protein